MAVYQSSRRDRVACWLCNLILDHLATTQYRNLVALSMRAGLPIVRMGLSMQAMADGIQEAMDKVVADAGTRTEG